MKGLFNEKAPLWECITRKCGDNPEPECVSKCVDEAMMKVGVKVYKHDKDTF